MEADEEINEIIGDVLAAEGEVEDGEVAEDEKQGIGPVAAEVSEEESSHSVDDLEEESLLQLEGAAAAARGGNRVTIGELNGVPLHYIRLAHPGPHDFPVDRSFLPVLERTVRTVRKRAEPNFGRLIKLASAGMLVKKPGMHGEGRACDWDAWTFEKAEIAPKKGDHASPSVAKRRRYWALAAICRSHSSFVLHGEFNPDHRDHIHQDNAASVAFDASSKANVKLCQAICNDIFNSSPKLDIDGAFGGNTRRAAQRALRILELEGDFSNVGVWRRFLRRSGKLGFDLSMRT